MINPIIKSAIIAAIEIARTALDEEGRDVNDASVEINRVVLEQLIYGNEMLLESDMNA